MSDIEKITSRRQRLEQLLRDQYYAEGQGLDDLINSCEQRLPQAVVKKMRLIAEIAQKLSDDVDYKVPDWAELDRMCRECEKELTPRSGRFVWGVAIVLMLAMTLGAVLFYHLNWDSISSHLP
ncbi:MULTISPECIES: DUF4145 domain-containing protein [Vibrio]|uniref:DUF4145 domain-containing protein n=1 Tax=Vibrio algicola TaxID=2662262 RepID=A0A5Q0T9Z9_9VIBR|nr:DUF4145 domain-containing protein [Vibrio algicola]MBD1576442.1 DUF4145 domain-containing protein [Vibrio sp. S11_S32]